MTRDELKENFLVAMDTLWVRKRRSALTVLGIVIGVTSVIAVAAIIQGLNRNVGDRVQSLGSRVLFLTRMPWGPPGRLPEKIRLRKHFRYEDALYIRERCRSCEYVSAFGTRALFFGGSNEIRAGREQVKEPILRGADPEYAEVLPLFGVGDGRFITHYDMEHRRYVCVLGAAVANSLFPTVDPVGREVVLNGLRFEVIGVMEKDPGLFGGGGVNRFVIIPYSTFHKLYPESREHFLAVSAPDASLLLQTKDEVTHITRQLRRVPLSAENDFEITASDFLLDLWKQLTGALVLLTAVISSIGLLVGGIGVMNIMLISVTERTQEIGVRKAVGARRQDIRAQFLIEAITLTGFGGVLGILLGIVVSWTVHLVFPRLPTEVSLLWVTLGFLISVSVGLFFGYYPANRAANLDPITCLRYE